MLVSNEDGVFAMIFFYSYNEGVVRVSAVGVLDSSAYLFISNNGRGVRSGAASFFDFLALYGRRAGVWRETRVG